MRTLLLLAVAVGLVGCDGHFHIGGNGVKGSGKIVKKTLSLSAFNALSHESIGEVEVNIGGAQKVEVETDDNILPLLTNEVKDSKLTLDTTKDISPTKLVYRITVPSLESMNLEGVGSTEITGLAAKSFKATLEGVGSMKISGTADEFNATLSGVGSLSAFDLKAKNVTVEVEGVGSAKIYASEKLDAKCSGVGSIEYKGDAKATTKSEGIGGISKAG